jgi:glycerol kinase
LADQSQLEVVRPKSVETTAIGAATLAGLAEGLWGSLDDLAGLWTEDRAFSPTVAAADTEAARQAWARAVQRSRNWARAADPTDLAADDG